METTIILLFLESGFSMMFRFPILVAPSAAPKTSFLVHTGVLRCDAVRVRVETVIQIPF